MDDKLEKLQELGAQKIYEDTHIPIKHVQAILHSSFEGFSKVQFLGFISIIEREYSLNLEEIRQSGEDFFVDKKISGENSSLFVSQKNSQKNSKTLLYSFFVFFVFLIVLTFNYISSPEVSQDTMSVDNTIIDSIKKDIIVERNVTKRENNSTTIEPEIILEENQKVVIETPVEDVDHSFEIVAKTKVWFGYIDMQTHKHYQKTLKGSIDLDPNKNWLLIFGHGHINMFVDSKAKKFKTYNNIRFLYRDGELTAISKKEFKKLNRGHSW